MKRTTLEKLMPLGSIVCLKGGKQRFMVVGRAQIDINSKCTYDYSACLYPQGLVDAKDLFMFQQEDIDNIIFVGLQDEDEFLFRSFLEEKLKAINMLEE